MRSFRIGNTDFGLDGATLEVSLLTYVSGETRIHFDFKGSPDTFEALARDEESPWSWALDPPSLYLDAAIPYALVQAGGETSAFDPNLDEYGLYLMEHCDLQALHLKLSPGVSVEVSGHADIWGKSKPFHLNCDEVVWDIRSGLRHQSPMSPAYTRWMRIRDWILENRWALLAVSTGLALALGLQSA